MKGYQLLIKLKELPTVWRQVLVPAGITFRALHYVIQYAMGWQDNHLHEFSSDDDPTVYTDNPEADNNYSHVPLASSSAVKIDAILERTGKLTYVYDLGDHWEHEIALEEVVDLEHSYPLCVGGGEPCPPEDVGGPFAYMEFLEAWYDPNHEEHDHSGSWGRMQGFTGSFDLSRANLSLRWKLPLGKSDVEKAAQQATEVIFHSTIPMAFRTEMPQEAIAQTHKLRFFLDLFTVLKERGPLKATAKGNLPAKLVVELYERGYDYLEPEHFDTVRKEDDAWFLRDLHEMAHIGGYVCRRTGKIMLTKKGLALLDGPVEVAYLNLWLCFAVHYSQYYAEGYAPFHPMYIGSLIHLLKEYGDEERNVVFYGEKLVEQYPHLLQSYAGRWRHTSDEENLDYFGHAIFFWIMQRCLEEFGLVKTRSIPGADIRNGTKLVQKTELLEQVCVAW